MLLLCCKLSYNRLQNAVNLIFIMMCTYLDVSTHIISQDCVKERATKSILCVRDVSENEAKQIVDKVFSTCFKDTSPFERIPP